MNMNRGTVCFFIGTEAEFIKIFPVIIEIQSRNLNYKIISSGQNDISNSSVLKYVNNGRIDALLSDNSKIEKSALGLLRWFFTTSKKSVKSVRDQLREVNFKRSMMVVHGDTVSTVMGAKLGVALGMMVAHVEAGLRSHDYFNPFPEEIDRILTSRVARIHFAPGDEAMRNLINAKGEKINTIYNTNLDSLKISNAITSGSATSDYFSGEYFVFVMHRQENLAKKEFVSAVLNKIIKASKRIKCIMIMYLPTVSALQRMGLLNNLMNVKTITTIPRMEYFDFMKLLTNAKFIISDGGSNQEELSYMGKPCLILRRKTERNEGIGRNVILYGGNINMIDYFAANYGLYERPVEFSDVSPSKIIADKLVDYINR